MNSFDLEFFRHAGSSYQKQSACNIRSAAANTKKNLYFKSFISGGGGVLLQIVISPFMFEILKNGFQLLSLPSFENVKNMLECEQIMALVQGDGCCWIN